MKILRAVIATGVVLVIVSLVGPGAAVATHLCEETRVTLYTNTCEKTSAYNTYISTWLAVNRTTSIKSHSGETLASCKRASLPGNVSSTGGSGQPVIIRLSGLNFENCTTKVWALESGSIGIEYVHESTPKVWGINQTIEVQIFGLSCIYAITKWTHLGYWQQFSGGIPTISIGPQSIWEDNMKLYAGSWLCPSSANWVGEFEITGPYFVEVIE